LAHLYGSVFVVLNVSEEVPDVVIHNLSLSGIRMQAERLHYCIAVRQGHAKKKPETFYIRADK
jgi:hypothetical protein